MWSNKDVKILNENLIQLLIIKCRIILKNLLCKLYAFISGNGCILKSLYPEMDRVIRLEDAKALRAIESFHNLLFNVSCPHKIFL